MAQIGACIGREFDHELLAAVVPLPEADLAAALDRLVAAELVFRRGIPPATTYIFKHALVRDAAYQSLLRKSRQDLHANIANALEEGFPHTLEARPELVARHFDEAGPPPERPSEQKVIMNLGGSRTGKRVLVAQSLALTGLTKPFDLEVFFGERVAVVGLNGTGKSHFLRLLAGAEVPHEGRWTLGARVVPGHFSQTHEHPELRGRALLAILEQRDLVRGPAMSRLRRYELQAGADQPFETLSGGQQARFQVLLLEVSGATLLLLDEPTDNLDLVSAEALEEALRSFEGTVLAVTHDRWFLRGFDRVVEFERDGTVHLISPRTAQEDTPANR